MGSNSSIGNSTSLIDKTNSTVINSPEITSTVPIMSSPLDMATNSNNHKVIINSTTRETMVSTTTSTVRANTHSTRISFSRTNSTVPATGSSVRTDLIQ